MEDIQGDRLTDASGQRPRYCCRKKPQCVERTQLDIGKLCRGKGYGEVSSYRFTVEAKLCI